MGPGMNPHLPARLLAALSLFAFNLSGCAALQPLLGAQPKPKLAYKDVRMRDLSFESITLDFDFEVTNPYDVGMSLASLDYKLDIDGKPLLQGQTEKELTVPAKGSSIVTLPYKVEFLKVTEALAALFSSRKELPYALAVTFGLDTPIGVVPVPMKTSGQLPLPKLPDVSVGKVKMGKMSMLGAQILFELNVKNKSSFPLAVKGSKVGVKLAGVEVTESQLDIPEVPADQAQTVQVPVNVSFLKLGAAAVKAIRSKKVDYALDGDLNLGVLKKDFSLSGQADL